MPNLDFEGQNTRYATHGLHAYAAKCPPQLVGYGLRYYSKPGETVLDPMAGSGTTLVEARLKGRHAIGYDLDPLARLIAKVKAQVLDDKEVERACETLMARSMRDLIALQTHQVTQALQRRAQLPEFVNRDYWFLPEVASALALLAWHIEHLETLQPVREFFWVAFSSLILAKTSVANARDIIHSRHHFQQHPQTPDVLEKFAKRIKQMRKQANEFQTLCAQAPPAKVEARLGDARKLCLRAESIDLVFTSPPYVTALDYTRAHFLAVAWMQAALGVGLDEYRACASRYIGSESGRLANMTQENDSLEELDQANAVLAQLEQKSLRQAALTRRYFNDMHSVFGKVVQVLRPRRHAIIVVCPSHIRKIVVPTHEILAEIGRSHGLRLKLQHTRTISERLRVMPYLQEAFGQRMDTEYVLVFQKIT
ncbi:MAG: hypothetical protein JNM09_23915 [Blastocatellia bacterium]|nr:hypothetical protein [Blastocatellia bacterium]